MHPTTERAAGGPGTIDNGALIRARDLTKSYYQGDLEVPALRGVDLDVGPGEFTALAGPSGSGKTTLLNIIGALDSPSGGTIEVGGQDVTELSKGDAADFRLDTVGFIFQAYNLVPVLTAYENAEFTLLLRGVPADERRSTVAPLLERVGLGDMMDRKPHELSGGQQQRVAVVRALATHPDIVLADEPTANLDSETSASLLDLMLELNDELGTTFVFSTHDQIVIDRARRTVRLLDGRVSRVEDRADTETDAGDTAGTDTHGSAGPEHPTAGPEHPTAGRGG